MHKSSYDNMQIFVDKYLQTFENIRILDIGSYDVNGTYKPLFNKLGWEYIGLDIEKGKNVDIVVGDIYNWKKEVQSDSFDVVISGQAFEHIEYIWLTMQEIARSMKPGGICCIIAPSAGPAHKYPVDCWRFYADGFKALAKYAKLDVVQVYVDKKAPVWRDCVLIAKKGD